jgi:guanyl-specific ribonuclease Sa
MALLGSVLASEACGRVPRPPQPGKPTVAAPADPGIPPEAWRVLAHIRAHHEAPAGYEGGRRFGNYEGVLPKTAADGRRLQYQEWDIHPHLEHVNRGAERIVTGSDGRAWFTADHYQHFLEMKDAP